MARAHFVKSSRKSSKPKICSQCREEIKPPEGYYWAAPGFRSSKKYRHLNHPFRPSELTTGAHASVLAAQEAFDDNVQTGFADIDELQSAYDEVKSAADELLQDRETALDAWENGNAMLEELRDQAQEAVDALESWSPDEEEFETPEDDEGNELDPDSDEYQEKYQEWLEDAISTAQEKIQEMGL